MKKTKEEEMQTTAATPTPGLPVEPPRANLQGYVDEDILSAAVREAKKHGLKKWQLMEWGLKAFLLKYNPKEAARLKIDPDHK